MSAQMTIFDVMVQPITRLDLGWKDYDSGDSAISEFGVVAGELDTELTCPNPKGGWKGCPWAKIQLHPFRAGMWMWSSSYSFSLAGSGYRVGPSWRRFAKTKEDALHYAKLELTDKIKNHAAVDRKAFNAVTAWLAGL